MKRNSCDYAREFRKSCETFSVVSVLASTPIHLLMCLDVVTEKNSCDLTNPLPNTYAATGVEYEKKILASAVSTSVWFVAIGVSLMMVLVVCLCSYYSAF